MLFPLVVLSCYLGQILASRGSPPAPVSSPVQGGGKPEKVVPCQAVSLVSQHPGERVGLIPGTVRLHVSEARRVCDAW